MHVLDILIRTYGDDEALEECRTSLEPILQNISNELVTYCPSEDEESDVLQKCQGNWILLLEEWEYLDDVGDMVGFLQKDHEESIAVVTCSRFDHKKSKEASVFYKPILFRRKEGLCLEEASLLATDCRRKDVFRLQGSLKGVLYGYQDGQEYRRALFQTIPELREEIKKEPKKIAGYGKLLEAYFSVNEWEPIIQFATEFLEHTLPTVEDAPWNDTFMGSFWAALVAANVRIFQDKEAIAVYEKMNLNEQIHPEARAYALKKVIWAFYHSKQFDKAAEAVASFFELYQKGDHVFGDVPVVREAFYAPDVQGVRAIGWLSALQNGQLEQAGAYMADMVAYDGERLGNGEDYVKDYLDALRDKASHPMYADMLCHVMQLHEGTYRSYVYAYLKDEEHPSEALVNAVAAQQEANEWVAYYKIIQANQKGERDCLPQLYEEFFSVVNDIFSFPKELWSIASQAGISLEPLFLEIPFRKYYGHGHVFRDFVDEETWEQETEEIFAMQTCPDIRYRLLELNRALQRVEWVTREEEASAKQSYIDAAEAFFAPYIPAEAMRINGPELPKEIKLMCKYREELK